MRLRAINRGSQQGPANLINAQYEIPQNSLQGSAGVGSRVDQEIVIVERFQNEQRTH